MVSVKAIDLRNGFKKVSDLVISGERVLISHPHNQNLVVLSEKEYNELDKVRRNAEFLGKVEKSRQDLEEERTYTFTIDELFSMEDMTASEMQDFAQKHKGQIV